MMNFFKKKKHEFVLGNLCNGFVEDITKAKDDVFAQKMMGDGIMITPDTGDIFAPCDAEVTMTFPTKHAIGLTLENGVEILLHFGIDTVELNGKGFEIFVQPGDHIQTGDRLWKADLAYLKEHVPSEAIMCIITTVPEGIVFEKQFGVKAKGETIALFK